MMKMDMKKIMIYLLSGLLLLTGCSDEELMPQLDTTPEYEKILAVDENASQADKTIYEWYKKYNTAFLYKFDDKDVHWLWSGTFVCYYEPWNVESEEDMAMLEEQLAVIETNLLSKYSEETLRQSLPYKVFLMKELRSRDSSLSSAWTTALSNGQDAMLVGYMQKNGSPFANSKFDSELGNIFNTFFFNSLSKRPDKFFESRIPVKYSLLTCPEDPAIEEEQKIKPDFDNPDHVANVCGYIVGYLSARTRLPNEIQDYADYLTFLTKNPGSEIRKITGFYWRIAWRATLFIEYCMEANGEDLIAVQNAAFPDDKVTMDDFKY